MLRVGVVCTSNTSYPVLVTFGTQSVERSGDCVGQMNASEMSCSSDDSSSIIFSVDIDGDSLGVDELYCYKCKNHYIEMKRI